MNPPKVDEMDYINFLIAAQQVFRSVEASRTHPLEEGAPAHDAYTRLLQRLPPESKKLWQEVEPLIQRKVGVLVMDDTTLDKPYASQMTRVTSHGSGKHGRVVQGIHLISLVWSDEGCRLPCDFRLYNKAQDALSKNDHFRDMLQEATERGFEPDLLAFDSWYRGLPNLKLLRKLKWHWLTQLKSNREVSLDRSGNRPIREIFIPVQGCLVPLKAYGWIKVFRTVGTNGDAEYWATSKLEMSIEQAAFYALDAWQVEVYHRGLKQFTGVERAQYRLEVSQRNHICLAIRAFVRLEAHRLHAGISWFEAKTAIIRSAMRHYLAHPTITLQPTV
jgi:putative transposase